MNEENVPARGSERSSSMDLRPVLWVPVITVLRLVDLVALMAFALGLLLIAAYTLRVSLTSLLRGTNASRSTRK